MCRKETCAMTLTRQLTLLVAATVVGAGAMLAAQSAPAKGAAKKPRVFFIEPKNNATVSSPVHMKFGSEGVQIAAVPPGDVTTTRPRMAHYHVGIDQDCLPAGKTIV